jgi:glycosyltransferase involved in cell wall biosynthesis
LEGHGHEVGVFSTEHEGNWPAPPDSAFVPAPDYAEMNRNKTLRGAWLAARRSVWSGEVAKALRGLLAAWKPDVAHLQNIHAYLTPSVLPELKRAGVPVVQTLHDFKWLCPDSTMWQGGRLCGACGGKAFWHCAAGRCKKGSLAASALAAAEGYVHRWKRAASMVDAWIAPSAFVKATFAACGLDGGKIRVVRHPHMPGGRDAMKARDGGYGLFVGALSSIKGAWVALEALKDVPGHELHVVGGGSEEEKGELQARAAALGVAERVSFLGPLHDEALWREQTEARYGVVPSLCPETLGYVAMEMLAVGKPVVASSIGGLPELVKDGETGLLFQPGDAGALAERMRRLAGDAGLSARLGEAGKALVARDCPPEGHYGKVMEVYREVGAEGTDGR